MTDCINVAKDVFAALSASQGIRDIVGERIYPIVKRNADNGAYIVYFRDGRCCVDDKDGHTSESADVTVIASAPDYGLSVDLAELVRESVLTYNGGDIMDIEFRSAEEACTNDGYLQTLQFKFYF